MSAPILRAVECTPVNGRLLYIVGPSGSGKDSLIDYARSRLPAGVNVVFAKRTITRPASAGGENHIAVTAAEFDARLTAGAFAMHWRANGLAYGIGREIHNQLDEGGTVVVSGSRAHLPRALADFPDMKVVAITASPETLRARLNSRGREDTANIQARLARAPSFALPPGTAAFEISNDGDIAQAGGRLLGLLA